MECPRCHSKDLEFLAQDFTTGVIAPDGYRETEYLEGFQCLKCGLCFETEELEEEEICLQT
jgi:hypothetical protein